MNDVVKSMERFIRRVVALPLLRLVFRNPVVEAPIDLSTVKRILILRHDRIGDMIITFPILRALKRRNPKVKLCVLASEANVAVAKNNQLIDELYVLERNWFRLVPQVKRLRDERFDVVLNLVFNRTTGPGILANLIAPHGHKVGQGPEGYAFYFNRMAKLQRFEQHMAESYISLVEQVFGIVVDDEERRLQIDIRPECRTKVDSWLKNSSLCRKFCIEPGFLPYIVVNPSGKDSERRLSVSQVGAMVHRLCSKSGFRTVLLEPPDYPELLSALSTRAEFARCLVFRTGREAPFEEIASLVEGSLVVITPDTSLVHFASAGGTPVFGIYTDPKGSKEWLPYRIQNDLVTSQDDQPISAIDNAVLIARAEQFIATVIANQKTITFRGQ